MHTKAVFRAAQAMNDAGIDVLRFNFRGVGLSTGSFDEGIGERDDARWALDWMTTRYPDAPVVLGGFSFGSRVALPVGAEDTRVRALVGLGVPLSMYEYDFLRDVRLPTLVVQGELDEFGSGEEVDALLTPMGPHVTVVRVPGSDHFFHGHFDQLKAAITDYFVTGPGARALDVEREGVASTGKAVH